MAAWLTREHLAVHLRAAISAVDVLAADQACDAAAAIVEAYCGRTFTGSEPLIAAARGVALRIASDIFANPLDRASYSGPEGLSFTSRPRLLTQDERDILEPLRLRTRHAMGSARLGVAPWLGAS